VLARHPVSGLVVGHEHQRALGPVVTEQQRQRLALAARKGQDAPRPPPGGDTPPPLVGARGPVQEVFPAPAEVIAFEGAPRPPVDLPQRIVLAALVRIQGQPPGDPLQRRQISPGQIAHGALEDHRADQRAEPLGGRPGCGRRGGQSQPQGRDRHLQGLVACPLTKVVRLVDDQQAELVPQPRHVTIGAGEGRDGDRTQDPQPVAELADPPVPDRRQRDRPLFEQHAGRHQAEAGGAGRRDGVKRDARLAAAGGQHHLAPPAGLAPGRQRRLLVRAQLERPESGRWREARTGLRLDRDTAPPQLGGECVGQPRRRAEGAHPRVPEHAAEGARLKLRRQIGQQQRSAIEDQAHAPGRCERRASAGDSCARGATRATRAADSR
jgi:hypothetical protein